MNKKLIKNKNKNGGFILGTKLSRSQNILNFHLPQVYLHLETYLIDFFFPRELNPACVMNIIDHYVKVLFFLFFFLRETFEMMQDDI